MTTEAAIAALARTIGEIDGKLDTVIDAQREHGTRLRSLEDVSVADRAVASRVAQIRAEGTITKRWVVQTLIAFVVAMATIAGIAAAVVAEVVR